MRSLFPGLALAWLAASAAFAAAPTPTPIPVPNATDLRGLKGAYRGSAKVVVRGVAPYRGRAQIRFVPRGENAATVTINAWIESDAGRFSVSNTLDFAQNGVARGRNLSPGVVTSAPFEGTYTATTTKIAFHGTFEFGGSRGVYRGQIAKDDLGWLTVTWRILPFLPKSDPHDADQVGPAAYTYIYKVRLPKK